MEDDDYYLIVRIEKYDDEEIIDVLYESKDILFDTLNESRKTDEDYKYYFTSNKEILSIFNHKFKKSDFQKIFDFLEKSGYNDHYKDMIKYINYSEINDFFTMKDIIS